MSNKKYSFKINDLCRRLLYVTGITLKSGKVHKKIDFSKIMNIALIDFMTKKHEKNLISIHIEVLKMEAGEINREIDKKVHRIKLIQEEKHRLEKIDLKNMIRT